MMSVLLFAACSPQEDAKYALGNMSPVTDDQVSFSITPSAASDNIVTIANTTSPKGVYSAQWTLADNTVQKGDSIKLTYPQAGDYPIKLTIFNPDGTTASKTQTIHIANDDFSLISTPTYVNLTGGGANANGKTWVFDQYNNFAAEVKAATGLAVTGHLGLGPEGSYGQSWWGAAANEKSAWKMYDFKFTFIQNGLKLNIVNAGEGYGRVKSMAAGGFAMTGSSGDDAFFTYNGGSYNFIINESGKYPQLKLSGNSFMGYYCGTQNYDIIYETDKVLALRVDNAIEGQDWVFVYCQPELNKPKPPVVKDLLAVPLSEDFESATPKVNFQNENMGALTAFSYANPAPVPINQSSKVFLYQKSTDFYSNVFYIAPNRFDLSTQNKIKVKVFIPSYNDYVTANTTAGSWISNNKLLPQLSVKLQNSLLGGNAYTTQTEIIQGDLAKDKWLELTFDFSGVSTRTDYDKIVVQFGAEGQSGTGIFFMDDFSFNN